MYQTPEEVFGAKNLEKKNAGHTKTNFVHFIILHNFLSVIIIQLRTRLNEKAI